MRRNPAGEPWQILFTKLAQKDARRIASAGLRQKVEELLRVLARKPFEQPPRFEKLLGDLRGAYSAETNIQHRLVYQVIEESRIVKVSAHVDSLRVATPASSTPAPPSPQ